MAIMLARDSSMTMQRIALAALILLGCQTTYKEGAYVCTIPLQPGQCPPSWYCHVDGHCWSRPEDASMALDSGGSAGDAAPNDAGQDVGERVDASRCQVEACDGVDNDCDARVDEGLATVGDAVAAAPASAVVQQTPVILALSDGFGIVFQHQTGGTTTPLYETRWVRIAVDGTPSSAPVPIPGSPSASSVAAIVGGNDVVAAVTPNCVGVCMPSHDLFAFHSADGTLSVPATGSAFVVQSAVAYGQRVVSATADRVSYYGILAGTDPYPLHRYRVVLAGTPSVASSFDTHAAVHPNGWDVTSSGSDEYLAFVSSGIVLRSTAAADSSTTTQLVGQLAGFPADVLHVAVASRDPAIDVSATNPLAVVAAWQNPNGISFAVVSDVAPLQVGSIIALPGSLGNGPSGSGLAIVGVPGSSGAHFYVASMDDLDASHQTLRVWEVQGDQVRMLPVAGDWSRYGTQITMAVSGGVVRVAELDDASNVVTRSIGCR